MSRATDVRACRPLEAGTRRSAPPRSISKGAFTCGITINRIYPNMFLIVLLLQFQLPTTSQGGRTYFRNMGNWWFLVEDSKMIKWRWFRGKTSRFSPAGHGVAPVWDVCGANHQWQVADRVSSRRHSKSLGSLEKKWQNNYEKKNNASIKQSTMPLMVAGMLTWPIKWVVKKPPCEIPTTATLDASTSPSLITWSSAARQSWTSCSEIYLIFSQGEGSHQQHNWRAPTWDPTFPVSDCKASSP